MPERDKPKNIILIIGSGLGLTHLSTISYYSSQPLILEQFSVTGLQTPHTFNNLVADPIASTSAIASGEKNLKGDIGLQEIKKRNSILTLAKQAGYATGLITTSSFDHPLPVCFLGNTDLQTVQQPSHLLVLSGLDLFIGGGAKTFGSTIDKNVVNAKQFQLDDYSEKFIPDVNKQAILFTSPDTPLKASKGRKYLPKATKYAANYLSQKSEAGFFLVVLSTQINDSALTGDVNQLTAELQDYNQTVEAALNFANMDKETLVITTSDVESGGLAINPGSEPDSLLLVFNNSSHTGTFLPIFATGPGAERFSGIYDNTDIFFKIKSALGF